MQHRPADVDIGGLPRAPFLTPEWAAALEDDRQRGAAELTPRESEALRLYAMGLPLKSVARRIGIASETAKEYLEVADTGS